MHKRSIHSAFTLIELLVVIAVIAVLAVVVVLTLNPAQLLAQSRDANRVSDMATLNSAIGLYQTDMGGAGSIGSSSVIYGSLVDSSSTCGSLGLPALPTSTIYNCSTATTTRLVNGQGWIPLDFTKISAGAPFGSLPVDPTNASSSGLYYSYVASGTQYMVTAIPESLKQKQSLGQGSMIPNYPNIIANGSSLVINPLFNPAGLVGYWPMDEGSGSSTQDMSGNNNLGTWAGTPAGTNGTYYSTGKVGNWAGAFSGNGGPYALIPDAPSLNPTSGITVSAWVNPTAWGATNKFVVAKSLGYYNQDGYGLDSYSGNLLQFNYSPSSVLHAWTPTAGWHLVTGTAAPGGLIAEYLDGNLFATAACSTTVTTSVKRLVIGSVDANLGVAEYNGLIDDVRIYNRALSAAEIAALYSAGK